MSLNPVSPWYWLISAVVLIILELVLGTSFFILWLGFSAAIVGIVTLVYPIPVLEYQFLLFTTVALVCLLFWYVRLRRFKSNTCDLKLNRRGEQYIGRIIILKEPIENGYGKIKIDDSYWRIEGPDLPIGTLVKIIDIDGVILKVTKSS